MAYSEKVNRAVCMQGEATKEDAANPLPEDTALEVGDVIFAQDTTKFSRFIAWATDNDMGHALRITNRDGNVSGEALRLGLNLKVIDAVGGGVRNAWLWNALGRGAKIRVYRVKYDTGHLWYKSLEFLMNAIGHKYNITGAIGSSPMIPSWHGASTKDATADQKFFCSGLIGMALQKERVLDWTGMARDMTTASPKDVEKLVVKSRWFGGAPVYRSDKRDVVNHMGSTDTVVTVPWRLPRYWKVTAEGMRCFSKEQAIKELETQDGCTEAAPCGTLEVGEIVIAHHKLIDGNEDSDFVWLRVDQKQQVSNDVLKDSVDFDASCAGKYVMLFPDERGQARLKLLALREDDGTVADEGGGISKLPLSNSLLRHITNIRPHGGESSFSDPDATGQSYGEYLTKRPPGENVLDLFEDEQSMEVPDEAKTLGRIS
eukprot:TRINITY_DN15968_c0_g1_i1.p1 TRINITY_DN15968_c0_g1~~TRINITY_DN15968_c0_g1_i1.p1  ORF type:complete len:430 (-),score=89.24 TRINITY_DN15968_c0_g1_i1:132-1421(-)